MKLKQFCQLFLIAFCFISCNESISRQTNDEKRLTLQKDFFEFLKYRDKELKLYEDFIGMDDSSRSINKETFLKLLSRGDYFPMRESSPDSVSRYKLYRIDGAVHQDIPSTIKDWAKEEYNNFKLEGTELPPYYLMDMNGVVYNKENTVGKILVLKCWFINCKPCVAEMPALNRIKERYKDKSDILFISLCLDPRKDVERFLLQTKFDYATVPDQDTYLSDSLGIGSFPTHFVINRQGRIVKKSNDYRAMLYALEKQVAK